MRIILADPHEGPLLGVSEAIKNEPELELVGAVTDAAGLLELANRQPVDVILLDKELPGMDISDIISRLHELVPKPNVITMSCELQDSRKMLRAGADAYVSKGDEPDWLLEKLHQYAKQVSTKEDANRNIKP